MLLVRREVVIGILKMSQLRQRLLKATHVIFILNYMHKLQSTAVLVVSRSIFTATVTRQINECNTLHYVAWYR